MLQKKCPCFPTHRRSVGQEKWPACSAVLLLHGAMKQDRRVGGANFETHFPCHTRFRHVFVLLVQFAVLQNGGSEPRFLPGKLSADTGQQGKRQRHAKPLQRKAVLLFGVDCTWNASYQDRQSYRSSSRISRLGLSRGCWQPPQFAEAVSQVGSNVHAGLCLQRVA